MREIVRTNDEVLLSFLVSLLGDAGITAHVMDRNMSALEGSVGMLPRRLLVVDEDLDAALRIVREAGLGQWIVQS